MGEGLEVRDGGWGRAHCYVFPIVPEMEDKEECCSSRLVLKMLPRSASPLSAKGMATPKGRVPDASPRKATAALPAKEADVGQAKAKTAQAVLAQGQSSEQAAVGTTLGLATSKETVRGATRDQCASAAAAESLPHQSTSEAAMREIKSAPPASHGNKQTAGTSPLQGATAQQALGLRALSPLELSSEAEVNPPPRLGRGQKG